MSQMYMLPVREGVMLRQPRCVRCGELIDVFAQFVCDECRKLYIGQFFKWRTAAPPSRDHRRTV